MKLYEKGVYLVDGREIVEDPAGVSITQEEAAANTIAYGILKEHNTSDSMENLQIKFDKLTSHDITFVGIIQTARASGLTKFPMPYVLTNCHNSLCAVGGTINEDDHMFGLTCAKRYGGVYVPPHQAVIHQYACRGRKDDSRLGQPYKIRRSWHYGHGRGRSGAGEAAFESDL